ncbi:MAG: DEAD/DEAH box helicase, partial [Actinomycetota bacterium]
RADALEKDLSGQKRRLRTRTEGLARVFERVVAVLTELGYIDLTGRPTERGDRLCRIYSEGDLLVAEALERGMLQPLQSPADLAAVVSSFVFSPRGLAVEPAWPNEQVRGGYVAIRRLWREIERLEEGRGLALSREPEPGFADAIHAWTDGEPLEEVLAFAEMSAGDFVRSAKQVWDLLRQLVEVSDDAELSARCRKAAAEIYRGVVAYSGAL